MTPGNHRSKTQRDTRKCLLDKAEQLFAEFGLSAVSIRDITGAAKANLGAINYYFGSKEGLIEAILERRLGPLCQAQLRYLDAAERAVEEAPPSLEVVLEALFRPEVELALGTDKGGVTFGRMMARCFVDGNPAVERMLRKYFEPLSKRFEAALQRAEPHLTPEEVFWRGHLLMGGLHQSLLAVNRRLPNGCYFKVDAETYLRRFMAFAVAGFRAPSPLQRKESAE